MTDLITPVTPDQLPPPPEVGWFGPDLSLTPAVDLLAALIEAFDAGRGPAEPVVPTGIAAFDDPGGGSPPAPSRSCARPPAATTPHCWWPPVCMPPAATTSWTSTPSTPPPPASQRFWRR